MAAVLQGEWESEKNENYEEFLKAVGVGAIKRGMAVKMATTLTITPVGSDKMKIKTVTGPNSKTRESPIGSNFEQEGPGGGKVKGCWQVEGNKMVGSFKSEKGKDFIMSREIVDGKLHQVMDFDGTKCTRIFKRTK